MTCTTILLLVELAFVTLLLLVNYVILVISNEACQKYLKKLLYPRRTCTLLFWFLRHLVPHTRADASLLTRDFSMCPSGSDFNFVT